MALMKNVQVYWASLSEPNRTWEPHTYQITAIVDKKTAAEFEGRGHKLKEIDEQPGVFFKQYDKRPDGSSNPPIRVVDANKNPFIDSDGSPMAVGNTSVCNIQYEERTFENKFGTFHWNLLKAVQVLKHVPYASSSADEFDVEGDADDIEF